MLHLPGMIEELTVGLLLAFLSGITILAYRHPEAYRERLHYPLLIVAMLDVAFFVGCAHGLTIARNRLIPFIADEKFDAALRAISALNESLAQYALLACGVVVHLIFLFYLRQILGPSGNSKHQ